MCRKLIYLISFVLVLGLASPAAALLPGDLNTPVLIPATGQAPVINGDREGLWSDRHTITKISNGAAPGDPCVADRTSSWWAMWDSQNFYVFMDVNDANLVGDRPELYNCDSVEVMIDIGNDKKVGAPYGPDDYQYRFAWPSPYLIGPPPKTQGEEFWHSVTSMPGVQWVMKNHPKGQDPNGYTVEMKFPWTSLNIQNRPGKGPPALGALMGLDFAVNDEDVTNGNRRTKWSWYATLDSAWNNASLLGTVKFVGALTATNPNPVNEANGVLDTILQWTAGAGAKTHDVFFGTAHLPPKVAAGLPLSPSSYDPPALSPGTKYFWKVDEVNVGTTWPGYEWCFTTAPTKAHDPDPYDGDPVVFVDANLSWGTGFYATTHNVYLSTNPALPLPDSLVSTGEATTTYDPLYNLNEKTRYYWRVDEVNGPPDYHVYTGTQWSFTTASARIGLTGEYFDNADLFGNPVLTRTDYNIDFNWGQDAPDPLLPVDGFSIRWTAEVNVPFDGDYTFFVVRSVRPASDGVRLWVNGEKLVDNWPGVDTILEDSGIIENLSADEPALLVMEFQDTATTAVAQLSWEGPSLPRQVIPVGRFTRPLLTMARSPSPFNKDTEVDKNPTLTWTPGIYADVRPGHTGHKVYFDTNEAKVIARHGCEVNDVPTNDPCYKPGLLPYPKTYYWAVDEVNSSPSPGIWYGNVWRFTVPIYKVVDNFELYPKTGTQDLENPSYLLTPEGLRLLRGTWIDGLRNMAWSGYYLPITTATSGSYVQLNTDPCDGATNWVLYNNRNTAQGGTKSMKFYYDNDGSISWVNDLKLPITSPSYGSNWNYTTPNYYSEASAAVDNAVRLNPNNQDSLGMSKDWSGYKLLKLSYYGDPNNTVDPCDKLYVTLTDRSASGHVATVTNPDQTYIQRAGWRDWYISLSIGSGSFKAKNGSLDLTDVNRIYIGIGNKAHPVSGGKGAIFFDDIRLYPVSVCIPGTVAGDFNGDCKIDGNDLQRMSQIWLGQTPIPAPVIDINTSSPDLTVDTILSSWKNNGSAKGYFVDFNMPKQPGLRPTVKMVGGVKAVVFDGNDIMKANIKAPASITGTNPWTVIYTVWNRDIGLAERVFTWAKRGGTIEGKFADVGYGTAPSYGAVGHGATVNPAEDPNYDMGFDGGVPVAATWHTIGVTYQGSPSSVQTVIVDGVVNATKVMTLDIWPDCNMVIGSAYDGNNVNVKISPNEALFFSGALAKLQVYSVAIPLKDLAVLMGTPIDMKQDNVINFKDLALFANNWMVGPVLFP